MRLFVAALMVALVCPAAAMAAPQTSTLTAPLARSGSAKAPQAGDSVRVAMRQQTLPPGGQLPEHRQAGERYLYVVAGRLKVSDLVTGEEQVVDAGKMAVERPGDWHVATAMGAEPATFYVIDRGPVDQAATAQAGAPGGDSRGN